MRTFFVRFTYLVMVLLAMTDSGYGQNVVGPFSLRWSTFLKATSVGTLNEVSDVAVDSAGFIYLAGRCDSTMPVTPGAAQTQFGGSGNYGSDAFVAKLTQDAKSLIYATYIGGSGDDYANAIEVNANGEVFITGHTASTDFPTTSGAFQSTSITGHSAFVVKLSADGSKKVWATHPGGLGDDTGEDIAVNSMGEVYVTGRTTSLNFPVSPNAIQPTNGGKDDAFICQLDSSGGTLLFGSYWGGASDEHAYGLALGNNVLVVGGRTSSADYMVSPFAVQKTLKGSQDGFLLAIDLATKNIRFSTYLGGSDSEVISQIKSDSVDNVIVTGNTSSSDFPASPGAYQSTLKGPEDAFVARLTSNGVQLDMSTYFGGVGNDQGQDVQIDADGSIYLAGQTDSEDLPTSGRSYQSSHAGAQDIFLAHLSRNGTQVDCGGVTYIGGTGNDFMVRTALIPGLQTGLIVSATSTSSDFPLTANVYESKKINGKGYQPAVMKWNIMPDTIEQAGTVICSGDSTLIMATDSAGWYLWTSPEGIDTSTVPYIVIHPAQSGSYLAAGMDGACISFLQKFQVNVNDPIADAGRDTIIVAGGKAQLRGFGGTSYQWMPSTGLSCTTCRDPVATPDSTTTYRLIVSDSIGCKAMDSVTIFVARCNKEAVRFPNVFTPNDDGWNDHFGINGLVKSFEMEVYNRWGQLIYRSDSDQDVWDGHVHGRPAAEGTYYVIVTGECYGNNHFIRTGYLTLIR
ncbi:MAG: gliding motility-associated C-terminal domain-containing protein [Flavobacteriales bacterium]|nr:gliding motility-associated C-terminal domain-containing protein [Flavobacteriales bacterium]